MKALTVVHAETPYIDHPREMGEETTRYNKEVFDRIAQEIGVYLKGDNKVYFLAGESESEDSELIYPPMRRYFPGMVFIPDGKGDQFLVAKDWLMRDGIEEAHIAGVSYGSCVIDFFRTLQGLGPEGVSRDDHRSAKLLKWSMKKFRRVYDFKLKAIIRDELTNKC